MVVVDFIQRVSSYPVVKSTFSQANSYYSWAKDQNAYVRSAAVFTEDSVWKMANTAQPLVERFDKRIQSVDELACQRLDWLEEKYPVVKEPTDVVVDKTSAYYNESVKPKVDIVVRPITAAVQTVNYAKKFSQHKIEEVRTTTLETVHKARDFSVAKYRQLIYSKYGQTGLQKLDEMLKFVDEYVEKYIPAEKTKEKEVEESEDEKEVEEAPEQSEPSEALRKALDISGKLRRRLYSRAVREVMRLKETGNERVVKPIEEIRVKLDKVREEFWVKFEEREAEHSKTECCEAEKNDLHGIQLIVPTARVYLHKMHALSSAGVELTLENVPEKALKLPALIRYRTRKGVKEVMSTVGTVMETFANNPLFNAMLERLHITIYAQEDEDIEMESLRHESESESDSEETDETEVKEDQETNTESPSTVDNSASSEDATSSDGTKTDSFRVGLDLNVSANLIN